MKNGLAGFRVKKKKLAEGGSRIIVPPYLAEAIRQTARYDKLRTVEFLERCVVLYWLKHHPDWKIQESDVGPPIDEKNR